MAETVWTLNDASPTTMGMAFVPVYPWDQLNLSYWGPPTSILLPNQQQSSGLSTNKCLCSGFFGPRP